MFGVVLYRINSMGLLPLSPGDWVGILKDSIPEKTLLNSN